VTLALALVVDRLRRARLRVVVNPARGFVHVLIPARCWRLAAMVERAGFVPVPVRLRVGQPVPWVCRF
jgi:hypothetical protein